MTSDSLTLWCQNPTTIWKIRFLTLTYTMGTLSDWGFYSQALAVVCLAQPPCWTLRSCLCQCARPLLPRGDPFLRVSALPPAGWSRCPLPPAPTEYQRSGLHLRGRQVAQEALRSTQIHEGIWQQVTHLLGASEPCSSQTPSCSAASFELPSSHLPRRRVARPGPYACCSASSQHCSLMLIP